MKTYPEHTLIIDYTGDFEGDTFYRNQPKVSVWENYTNTETCHWKPGSQHGVAAVASSDIPGWRMWEFIQDCYLPIKGVVVYE